MGRGLSVRKGSNSCPPNPKPCWPRHHWITRPPRSFWAQRRISVFALLFVIPQRTEGVGLVAQSFSLGASPGSNPTQKSVLQPQV